MIVGSHRVPEETPVVLRRSVIITTTIKSEEETSGIATSQLEVLVTLPAFISLVNDGRKPSLDRNPATKHAAKTRIQNEEIVSRSMRNGNLV